MHIKPLSTPEEFERYVDFAHEVYRDNQYWVPTDKHHLPHLLADEAGFGPGSKIQPYLGRAGRSDTRHSRGD